MDSPDDKESDNECPEEYKDIFSSRTWCFEKKFVNSELAMNYVKAEKCWNIDKKKCCAVVGGYKAIYRCSENDDWNIQCAAEKCIFFPNRSSEVLIFRSETFHKHKSGSLNYSLPMDRVKELVELNTKPKDIEHQLTFEGFKFQPKQLRNAIMKLISKKQLDVESTNYTMVKMFDCLEDVHEYLLKRKIWSWRSTERGVRYNYRCNQVPKNGLQCAAHMFFTCNEINGIVTLYKSNDEHTHNSILSKSVMAKESVDTDPLYVEEITEIYTEPEDEESFLGNIVDNISNPSNSDMISADIAPTPDKTVNMIEDEPENLDKFIIQRTFPNFAKAEEHLRDVKIWTSCGTSMGRSCLKEHYNCELVDHTGAACPAKLYLMHSNKTGKVNLYRNKHNHTHQNTIGLNDTEADTEAFIEDHQLEIITSYDDCGDEIIMDEVPTNDLIGEEIIIGDYVDENQFAIEVNSDDWIFERKFGNYSAAQLYMKNHYMELYQRQELSEGGVQEYYKCNLIQNPALECNVLMFIEYSDELTEVLLYKNINDKHTHDFVAPIQATPQVRKIKLNSLNHAKVNIRTIEKWLKLIAFVPSCNDHKAFCANYTIDNKNQTFQCFITTKRLLRTALDSRIIHADFKCTLNWQTHHILILGTTDMDQNFHSFGICIGPVKTERDYEFAFRSINIGVSLCFGCEYKPEVLLCNSKSTIQNAFTKVYGPEVKTVLCSEYVLIELFNNVKANVQNVASQNEIIQDLEKIQRVPSPEVFLEAIVLFFKKWSNETAFLDYLKTQWIHKNTNWYAGCIRYIPVSNKALAAEFRQIMAEYNSKLIRSFSPLKAFLTNVVVRWSNAYSTKGKSFARKPSIPIELYEEACAWNALQGQIDIEEIDSDTTYFYVPSEGTVIQHEKLSKYKQKFHQSLEEFFDIQFSFWEMKQNKDADITCTCPYFFKHFICKHALGMSTALNLYTYPTDLTDDDLILKKEEDDELESEEEILS